MKNFKEINVAQAKELIDQKDVQVIDIRDPNSYQQGHIENAVHVSGQNIDGFLTLIPKNKPLICYCYHGFSSQNAADFFVKNGFNEVYSLQGGFEEWRKTYEINN